MIATLDDAIFAASVEPLLLLSILRYGEDTVLLDDGDGWMR